MGLIMEDKPAEVSSRIPAMPATTIERDIVNMTEGALQQALLGLPEEYNTMSEKILESHIVPTELDYLLRSSFSREVERVHIYGGVIKAKDIYGDFCHKTYFYQKYIVNKKRLAWLVRPMPKYEKFMEAMLYLSNRRLWELINIPFKEKGKYNARLCEVGLSAIKLIKEAVKGSPIQRLETKTLNVNVDTVSPAKIHDMSMDQLEKEIEHLEKQLGRHQHGTEKNITRLPASGDSKDISVNQPSGDSQVESKY
jgi:hypothetical protein